DERVEGRPIVDRHVPVVDLARPVPQRPEVADAEAVSLAVLSARHDHVALAAAPVANAPLALTGVVPSAPDLVLQRVPVRVVSRQLRLVVLEHRVVARAAD